MYKAALRFAHRLFLLAELIFGTMDVCYFSIFAKYEGYFYRPVSYLMEGRLQIGLALDRGSRVFCRVSVNFQIQSLHLERMMDVLDGSRRSP
ncbi:hypothetical protein D3C76_1458000 [compost metagenome]